MMFYMMGTLLAWMIKTYVFVVQPCSESQAVHVYMSYINQTILTITLSKNFLGNGVKHADWNLGYVGNIVDISQPELPNLLV